MVPLVERVPIKGVISWNVSTGVVGANCGCGAEDELVEGWNSWEA